MKLSSARANLIIGTIQICLLSLGILICTHLTYKYSKVESDFTQDYAAAVAAQRGLSIYGDQLSQVANEFLPKRRYQNFHPPTTALFFQPIALLPYSLAFMLFNLVGIVLYLAIVEVSALELKLRNSTRNHLRALCLLWYPVAFCVGSGNFSIYLAFLIVLAWKMLSAKRSTFAGVLLGIAAALKLFPGLLIIHLFFDKDWKAIRSMVTTFLACLVAATTLVGLHDLLIYLTQVIGHDVEDYSKFILNISITGFATSLLTDTPWTFAPVNVPTLKVIVALTLNAAVLLLTCYKTKISLKDGNINNSYLLLTVSMILLSPISWSHMFVVLVPALIFVFQESFIAHKRKLPWCMLILLLMSLPDISIGNWLMQYYEPGRAQAWTIVIHKAGFFGLALLWLQLFQIVSSKHSSYPPNIRSVRTL